MNDRPWYEDAFAAGYLDVYPHRDLAAARTEVAGLVERGLAGRVLDLGCGFGRHTLALLESGLDVFGLDLSPDLLRHAARLEEGARLSGRLVRGDFRRLPFAAGALDGVVMLFSSFGYFDDRQNAGVLAEVARTLKPGAAAIFDLMNPTRIRATLVPESTNRRGELVLVERRSLEGRRVTKDVRVCGPDGSERSWREDVRLYEPDEFRALLDAHGLEHERSEGDFDGRPLADDTPRQIVWARRRPG